MFKRRTIGLQVILFIGALVGAILISICSAIRGSQIPNSYPLDINFDSYKPLPITNRPWIQSPSPSNQQSSNLQGSKQMKNFRPPTSQQRRSKVPLVKKSNLFKSNNIDNNLEPSINRKRTLENFKPTHYLIDDMVDRVVSESQINTTIPPLSDAQKLVLARQKMIDMQGRNQNVSIEDTNWKIAASCLFNQFGSQFIRNKDVKCAASQVVLSISRMQRAGCKYCESYFHCEGFSNVLKRCKDNYDVQETLNVIRECQGLTNSGDFESMEATRAPVAGADCQKKYLCNNNCMYNPSDGTCPRNNCLNTNTQFGDNRNQPYRSSYYRSRKARPTNIAYPQGSPIKDRILSERSESQQH